MLCRKQSKWINPYRDIFKAFTCKCDNSTLWSIGLFQSNYIQWDWQSANSTQKRFVSRRVWYVMWKNVRNLNLLTLYQGFFAVWDVDNYGNLSAQARVFNVPGPGYAPYSLTIIPGRNAYLTADVSLGADVFTFDGDTKISETSLTVPGQGAICWSSYSPQTGNYYVNDGCTGIVTEIHVDEQLKPSIAAVRLPYYFWLNILSLYTILAIPSRR